VAIHLRTSLPLAPDALLPGDPGRAMTMAQSLLVSPKMHNLHRGLWGYTGETATGRSLSIQSTGMGAPSAAIVIHELAELGVERAIRVGTCGALDPALELGDLLRVEAALPDTGVNRALDGDSGAIRADPGLLTALAAANGGSPATVATADLFYETSPEPRERWVAAGARAVEMESAALFEVGRARGVAVAALLIVSDVFPGGERVRIEEAALVGGVERMGGAAAAALEGERAERS
jgi:uridine phosphorylase